MMRAESIGSSTYVQEQKRAYAETGKFAEMYAEMKLVKREGNQVKLGSPLAASDAPDICAEKNPATYVLGENGFPVGMARWEDMGHYVAPVQPELREFPLSPKNPESIYDLPVSEWPDMAWSAGHICWDIDTEGMSPGEIYNAVKSVFEEYLGKDFLEPHYTKEAYGQEESYWGWSAAQVVCSEFDSVLAYCGIGYDDQGAAMREAAGYSGMSNDEIKAAVREKYPEVMTLRECIVMGWELYEMGVTSNNYGAGAESLVANATLNEVSNGVLKDTRKEMYNLLLDYPADFDRIVSNHDQKCANMTEFYQNQNKIPPTTRVLGLFKVSDSSQYTAKMMLKLWALL